MPDCIICKKVVRLPVINNVFTCHKGHSCMTCFRDYLGLNLNNQKLRSIHHRSCPVCAKVHFIRRLDSSTYSYDLSLIKTLDSDGEVDCPRCQGKVPNQTKLLDHIKNKCPQRTIGCTKCGNHHQSSFNCIIVKSKPVKVITFNENIRVIECTDCKKTFPEYSAWVQTDNTWKCHKCHVF